MFANKICFFNAFFLLAARAVSQLSAGILPFPLPAGFFGNRIDLLPLKIARTSQHHIIRCITLHKIVPHLFQSQIRNALLTAQHAVAAGMAVEMQASAPIHNIEARQVLIHRNLFFDNILLDIEIFVPKCRPHQLYPELRYLG